MLKKSLIGLLVVALAGGGYWYYADYQKKEKARLIKERDEQIARDLQRMKENSIKEAIAEKERKKKEVEEEKARQKRIAEGNPIIEEIVTYYPRTKQKKEQYTLVEGKKEGKGITWYENGQIKESMTYKNGELDGEYKYWKPNSEAYIDAYYIKKFYVNGELEGKSIDLYDKRESYYKSGRLHGKFRRWNNQDKKTIYEAYYEYGLLEGDVYEWNQDTIVAHHIYKNNMLIKSERFYTSGEKRSLEIYIPEKDIIQSTYWYQDGNIHFEGYKKQYIKSKFSLFPAGTLRYYLPSGQKYLEIPYVDIYDTHGFRFGTCYRWDDKGKLIAQVEIDDHKDWTKAYKVIMGTKEDCQETDEERFIGFSSGTYTFY